MKRKNRRNFSGNVGTTFATFQQVRQAETINVISVRMVPEQEALLLSCSASRKKKTAKKIDMTTVDDQHETALPL